MEYAEQGMTKPVQIQRYRQKGRVLVEDATSALMLYADHLDDKAATLLQVRSLLEAKAKEWQERDIREYQECQELYARMLRGEVVTMTASIGYVGCPSPNRHVAELLSLAATLGNQGK